MDAWKKAFKDNRVNIVKNLANPNAVADCLFSDRIFTEEMRDEVQVRFSLNGYICDPLHSKCLVYLIYFFY